MHPVLYFVILGVIGSLYTFDLDHTCDSTVCILQFEQEGIYRFRHESKVLERIEIQRLPNSFLDVSNMPMLQDVFIKYKEDLPLNPCEIFLNIGNTCIDLYIDSSKPHHCCKADSSISRMETSSQKTTSAVTKETQTFSPKTTSAVTKETQTFSPKTTSVVTKTKSTSLSISTEDSRHDADVSVSTEESAATEPAWQKAGQKVGLQIWRIVNFKVTEWPKEDYGKFYNGDSYIILNTYKDPNEEELQYDVHFWIGAQSTQDEYGTAAYKTVELDTFLDDKPIQHREVQGFESALFKSYFKTITIMKGGADSGFRTVKPEEYTPRLLHFSGSRKHVEVREVTRNKSSLKSDDVFILDQGLTIYQWNGKGSNKDERMKAMLYLQELKSERSGRASTEVLEEDSTEPGHDFFKSLTEEDDGDDDDSQFVAKDDEKELYRLSDASGKMTYRLEKKGDISQSDLDTKDVFILDTKKELYVWIGQGTSENERRNAMSYAHSFLMKSSHPLIPVTCVAEGRRLDAGFQMAIAA